MRECSLIRDLCPDADAFPKNCRRCYVFETYQRIRKEEEDNGKQMAGRRSRQKQGSGQNISSDSGGNAVLDVSVGTEPDRKIEVSMSYSDLKIICDLIDKAREEREK